MMDRPDLDVLGAELQRELQLVDWRVTYRYVRDLADAAGNAVYGLCERLVDNKTATILIRDPADPLPPGADVKPVESVLMHELVHLHMAPLAVNTPQGVTAEEQAVWPIADALTRWRGTARGGMVAQAIVTRAQKITFGKTEKRTERKMGANAKALAMLKAAMDSDGTKEESASARCLAALMADDEKAPDSEKKPEAPAARAADAEPEKKPDPAAARSATMTLAQVDARAQSIARSVVGEHAERSAIITKNSGALGPSLCETLSTLPLGDVKRIVAARLTDAPADAKPADQRAARPGVGPLPTLAGGEPINEETRQAITRMAKIMGLSTEAPQPIRIDSRGMHLSNLGSVAEFVKSQQAAVAGAR